MEHESSLMRWLLLRGMPKGIAKITATQGVGRKDMQQLLVDTRRHVQAVADLVENDPWLLGAELSLADLAVHTMCSVSIVSYFNWFRFVSVRFGSRRLFNPGQVAR